MIGLTRNTPRISHRKDILNHPRYTVNKSRATGDHLFTVYFACEFIKSDVEIKKNLYW